MLARGTEEAQCPRVPVNPSEVLTDFASTAGFEQERENATKLQARDLAYIVKAVLEMEDRGFTPELSVFATNPKDS
jgi:3-oxoacyl-[acyl-carrier protein] reductase